MLKCKRPGQSTELLAGSLEHDQMWHFRASVGSEWGTSPVHICAPHAEGSVCSQSSSLACRSLQLAAAGPFPPMPISNSPTSLSPSFRTCALEAFLSYIQKGNTREMPIYSPPR
ncbi:hematological and neurological expressed 1-like protein [Platysternon megacephalum]|uniref:Hematological and neurological expressed 1-like protein n=1 Tax=Platysternon megacephalum TaxID=55544 RepID=A0A4D9ECD6_9SAUR|nr:hematological and neurological expressed 1-like protein [Platysternon megacephalum]